MKKALGIILIITGIILAILSSIPDTTLSIVSAFEKNNINQWSYLIGTLFATALIIIVTFFVIRFGIKLVKK